MGKSGEITPSRKGKAGEALAAMLLQRRGYGILERNYHCRYGEIDLVAQKDDMIVFVEVKLRKNHAFASGADAVDTHKQQKLRRAALCWLSERESDAPCRFDVIELYTEERYAHFIENAF